MKYCLPRNALIFLVCITTACAGTTVHMEETKVMLSYDRNPDCQALKFDLQHGTIDSTAPCEVAITFNHAIGGKTFLFGVEINDHTAQTKQTVKVLRGTQLMVSLSYNDIIAMPSVKRDGVDVFQFDVPN
jgi:FKBP-type peptidyl-prolyl cis-trans isomerase 2